MKSTFNGSLPVRHSRVATSFAGLSDVRERAQSAQYSLTPLFRRDEVSDAVRGQALAWSGTYDNGWAIAHPLLDAMSTAHPWDQAHAYADGDGGLTDTNPHRDATYAEPDFNSVSESIGVAVTATTDYDDDWPIPPSLGFHLDDSFSQLASARTKCNDGNGVRIAILDVGYDPVHIVQPPNLRADLARDFLLSDLGLPGAAAPYPTGGILKFPGHGHATMSLLAGGNVAVDYMGLHCNEVGHPFAGEIGGAPQAEIVPIRISDSVISLYSRALALGDWLRLGVARWRSGCYFDESRRITIQGLGQGGQRCL